MQKLRYMIVLVLVAVFIAPILAQDDTSYELPAFGDELLVEAVFDDTLTAQLYGFYASEGDVVTITMTATDNDLDPYLLIFDATTGALIAQNDDIQAGNLAASLELDVEADGAYLVVATSLIYLDGTSSEADSKQDYTIAIVGATVPDTVEDDEIVAIAAQPITIGEQLASDSNVDNPANAFSFEAQVDDTIVLMIDSNEFFTVLHLFAPDGSRIAGDASAINTVLDTDGVYLVLAGDLFFYEALSEDGFFTGGTYSLELDNN